ncbi:MAG: hypothetical protein RLZZ584_820 [Pseudomonadota bacterium]
MFSTTTMKRLSSPGANGLLIGAAVLAGWWAWGWQGLVLAFTLIVFWMLLQFRRATRALQNAARRPMGRIDSVVMMQSRLEPGMQMAEVLQLSGSLGIQQGGRDEWLWSDAAGNDIVVTFRRGIVIRWAIARVDADDRTGADQQVDAGQAPPAPSGGG